MYVKSAAYVPGVPVLPDWMEEKCETRTDVLSESWKKLRREAPLILTHNSRLSGQSYVPPDSGDQEWQHYFPYPGKGRYRAQQHCSISNGSSRGSMGYDFVAISFCFIQSVGGIEKIPDSASA